MKYRHVICQEWKRNLRESSKPRFRIELHKECLKSTPLPLGTSRLLMKKHFCSNCRDRPPGRSKSVYFPAVWHNATTRATLELMRNPKATGRNRMRQMRRSNQAPKDLQCVGQTNKTPLTEESCMIPTNLHQYAFSVIAAKSCSWWRLSLGKTFQNTSASAKSFLGRIPIKFISSWVRLNASSSEKPSNIQRYFRHT